MLRLQYEPYLVSYTNTSAAPVVSFVFQSSASVDSMGIQQSIQSRRLKSRQSLVPPLRLFTLDFPLPQHCIICLDHGVFFPNSPPTPRCTHLAEVCLTCLETYACVGIKDGVSLKCPTVGCSSQMSVNQIRSSLGGGHKEVFEK